MASIFPRKYIIKQFKQLRQIFSVPFIGFPDIIIKEGLYTLKSFGTIPKMATIAVFKDAKNLDKALLS